mgnify:FL=1|jgi:uncharacterized protein YybS (DUF2232 family)
MKLVPEKSNTRAITEGAMLVGITVMLAFLNRYLPFLSLFLAIPVALVVVRHGFGFGLLAATVTTLLLFALTGISALIAAADVVIAGLALGVAHRRFLQRPSVAFLVTAAGYVVAFLFIVYVAVAIMGVSDVTPSATIDSILEMYDTMAEQMSEFGAPVSAIDTGMMRPYLMMSIPALVCLSAAGNAAISFWIFRKVLRRFRVQLADIPPFRRWRLGWTYGWGFVLGFLLVTLGGLRGIELLTRIGLNLFLVFYMVFMVQGLAVIVYYFARWQVPSGVKALLVVFGMFFGVVQLAFVATPWIGVLDAWLDFRKLEVSSDESDPDRRPQG